MARKKENTSFGEISESDFRGLFPNDHPSSTYHGLWKWRYETGKKFGLSEDLAIEWADLCVLPLRAERIRNKLINSMPKDDPLLLSLLRYIRGEVRKAEKRHDEKRRKLYVARDEDGGRPRTQLLEYKVALAFFQAVKKVSKSSTRGLLRAVRANNDAMEKYRELVNRATKHLPPTKKQEDYWEKQTKEVSRAQLVCIKKVGSNAWQAMPSEEKIKKIEAEMNFNFADRDEQFKMLEERLPKKNRLSSELVKQYQGESPSAKAEKWTTAFLEHAGLISECGRPPKI